MYLGCRPLPVVQALAWMRLEARGVRGAMAVHFTQRHLEKAAHDQLTEGGFIFPKLSQA